jgi:nucleoside-diphosphate kinase
MSASPRGIDATLVIIKPDAIKRELIGEVITRLERKGLKLAQMKKLRPSRDLVEAHYEEHRGREYFAELVDSMALQPVIVMEWMGLNAIPQVRTMLGATKPEERLPGTIRGDYSYSIRENICHASDTNESFIRELRLW